MTKSERRTLLIASCTASAVTPMTGSMMNLSLPGIGEAFSVGAHSLAYVNTIFLISSVIFMVPISRIADMYGRKKLFMFGLAVHVIASIGGYFSVSFPMLLGFRFMMGLGTAGMATTAMTMLTDAFPVHERGAAIGLNTASVYLGLSIGPVLGGFINDLFSWREVFLLTAPLITVALFAISRVKTDIVREIGRKFDSQGTVLYVTAVALTMAGLIYLPDKIAILSMAVGLMFFIAFFKYENRVEDPVLSVWIFSNKVFSRSSLASFLINTANFSVLYFTSLYLQSIGALSSAQAGFVILSQPIVQTVFTAYFGKLHDRMTDKRILPTAGVMVTLIAVMLMTTLSMELNLTLVVVCLTLFGMGNAIFNAPNTTTMMSSVLPSDRGSASATVAVVRQMGMAVSMAIAMGTISIVMGSLDMLGPLTYGKFVTVIQISFTISTFMCILAMLASWFRGDCSLSTSDVR